MRPLNLLDYERAARERLDPPVYDFFAGGACDEVTVRDNRRAFERIRLRPRVLRGAGTPDLSRSLLGERLLAPLLLAPTAFHALAHPEGERATARAARGQGCVMIASMASTTAIEDVVRGARAAVDAGPGVWLQIYVEPDRRRTAELVARAEQAGCTGLVWTVDSPAFGRRERDLRSGFVDLPEGLACRNLLPPGAGGRPADIGFDPDLGWEALAWLRSLTGMPVLLKGIVHPADARLAAEHGADGIIVSNHGGRQLDTSAASIDYLPDVVEALDRCGARLPVVVDGGIRRGTDVVKALALGASAVAIGRPVLWGLAVAGEEGVADVLGLLRRETELAATLCGCSSIDDLDRDLILPAPVFERAPSPGREVSS